MTLATDLRETRLLRGLTQTQAAAELGVHKNTIARWERGELPMALRSQQHVKLWIEKGTPDA